MIQSVEAYLEENLDAIVRFKPWQNEVNLPVLLRQIYEVYEADFLGVPCLLAIDKTESGQAPAAIAKHVAQMRLSGGEEIIYARDRFPSYNRLRLIRQKTPFLVPNNQMYLPMLGVDLREHFKRVVEKRKTISPSTQTLLLHVFYLGRGKKLTLGETAVNLGFSTMTMSRAFAELERLQIGEHTVRAKYRDFVVTESGPALWKKTLPFFRTPVKGRRYILGKIGEGPFTRAGLSALASYTNIAEPKIPVYACNSRLWKDLAQDQRLTVVPDLGDADIELWSYSPELFAKNKIADRLSLYLSMKGTRDERVETAIEKLLKEMPW